MRGRAPGGREEEPRRPGGHRCAEGAGETGEQQGLPRLRGQSDKLQCASGFRLPVCKARAALPDSLTLVLPQNQVRLFFARGAGSAAGGGGRRRERGGSGHGAGAGRRGAAPLPARGLRDGAGPRGGQSVSRSLPHGRVPEGRGKAGCRRTIWERRKGRRKVLLPAGLGRIAPRREGREEGLGGLGERRGGQDS